MRFALKFGNFFDLFLLIFITSCFQSTLNLVTRGFSLGGSQGREVFDHFEVQACQGGYCFGGKACVVLSEKYYTFTFISSIYFNSSGITLKNFVSNVQILEPLIIPCIKIIASIKPTP